MGEKTVSVPPDDPGMVQTIELLKRRWLSEKAFEIELTRPAFFDFRAGQTILLMHASLKRYYSLLSTPDDPTLALCVQHLRQGHLSPILANAEIGSRFKITGPHGYFTFKPSDRPPVFMATGSGIAPFVSFARSGVSDFTLVHQAISTEELYYQAYFHEITPKYFPCLAEAPITENSLLNTFCGKVSECIRKNLQPGGYDFYLCGEREMIRDVTHLVDENYPGSRVYTEVFF